MSAKGASLLGGSGGITSLTRHDLIANNKHIFRPILERSQDLDLIFDNEIQPENGDRVLLLLHIAFKNISFI